MEFAKGLFIGFMLGLLVAIYINLSNIEANAQVQMSASVEKSAYYLCQEKCEELINGEF